MKKLVYFLLAVSMILFSNSFALAEALNNSMESRVTSYEKRDLLGKDYMEFFNGLYINEAGMEVLKNTPEELILKVKMAAYDKEPFASVGVFTVELSMYPKEDVMKQKVVKIEKFTGPIDSTKGELDKELMEQTRDYQTVEKGSPVNIIGEKLYYDITHKGWPKAIWDFHFREESDLLFDKYEEIIAINKRIKQEGATPELEAKMHKLQEEVQALKKDLDAKEEETQHNLEEMNSKAS